MFLASHQTSSAKVTLRYQYTNHICARKLSHHWFRYWIVACSVPIHYLNQWSPIVIWTVRNHLHGFFFFSIISHWRKLILTCRIESHNYIDYYSDVIMSAMASLLPGVPSACLAVCSGADQRKHQSSASLALSREIHRWPVDSRWFRLTKGQYRGKCFIWWRHHDSVSLCADGSPRSLY